jgi:hypothetical protein
MRFPSRTTLGKIPKLISSSDKIVLKKVTFLQHTKNTSSRTRSKSDPHSFFYKCGLQ